MFPSGFHTSRAFAAAVTCALAHGSEPSFNRDIRPILSENCFHCHGQDPKHRGGDLRLDIREEAVALRDGIAAIVPGDPDHSEIIRRILSKDPRMVMPPPDAHMAAMPSAQIDTLKRWIKAGAPYEPHWAFVPPRKTEIPAGTNPVDHFINQRLAAEKIEPNRTADDETLVRRLHLDLTGLPPSPAEIDAALADASPDRWNQLAERLMASVHFAERMALPWLDGARYSDTHGYSIDDHRDMWAWRDWVIDAFRKNQPYDQFVLEQIAGDLIPAATPDQVAATGFLRNSMNTHEGGTIEEEYRVNYTVDKVDAVSTSILGLTMKCAQCHDHKYDPISQKEYFQMYAFFNTSSEPGKGGTNRSTTPVMEYRSPLGDGGIAGLKARLEELEHHRRHPLAPVVAARADWEKKQSPEPGPLADALKTPVPERNPDHWNAINEAFMKSDDPMAPRMQIAIKTIDMEIKVLKHDLQRGKTTVMVMDHKPELRKTHILERGAYDQPGEEVTPATPAVLPPLGAGENATRLDLARWIVHPEHPLTSRVIANRVWQMIFGRGIVETAGDFGNQGSWPSHPELLDWLAVDLVEQGWDLRHLIRTILESETYRRSSVTTPEQLEKDPRNLLLARSPRTRLDAEILRDQALAIGGLLNPAVGGPGVHPPQDDLWSEISHFGHEYPFTAQVFLVGQGASVYRRSLYTFWKRTSPPPVMSIFDAPTRETCAIIRNNTNTPLQALVLLNEPQFVEAGRALGQRMIAEGGNTAESRITHGFRLATGRKPKTAELAILTSALERNLARHEMETDAYAALGSTLINLDEFINRP
ncbi:MAG: PSD1 and planctomycete cytochrome C domain-containing protein [Luteolibacter sp.]